MPGLLVISNLILLSSEHILYYCNLLKFIETYFVTQERPSLVNVPCVLKFGVKLFGSVQIFYIFTVLFCPLVLSFNDKGMLQSPPVIVKLSISLLHTCLLHRF